MTDGYLFRVVPKDKGAAKTRRQYWYANIADRYAALAAVMLATITLGASVELVGFISQETLSLLGIQAGHIKRGSGRPKFVPEALGEQPDNPPPES